MTKIGKKAFYNCESLTSVVIPDSVTEVGASAFSGCVNLTNVTVSGKTFIGAWAFSDCPCEEDVLNARKTIRLDPKSQIFVWTDDFGWDDSIEDADPEPVTLNCTMAELLADPDEHLEDFRKKFFDVSNLADAFYELSFSKDDDFYYKVNFYDSYYGCPPEYNNDPVVVMKYALPDDWEPDH